MKRAIYTYCATRFDEPGGGWGFYSYSNGLNTLFDDKAQFEEKLGSRVYTSPDNNRIWLRTPFTDTPETYDYEQTAIKKYHPEMFSYRIIHLGSIDYSCLMYAKNLGREIINANRPSNQVVYSLIGHGDEITDYPCLYEGNQEFEQYSREFFKKSQGQASPLEEIKPCVGNSITRESVHRFLKEDTDRVEDLIILFYTLINEHSNNQRPILICDQKENIIYWIAAVTLLFPLEIAKKIEFSTYDYLDNGDQVVTLQLPLCGVYSPTINDAPESRATNYDLDTLQGNDNVVIFDLECVIKPEVATNAFEKVIREFCKGNEEPLLNYHKYIINKTTYRDYGYEYTFFCCSDNDQIKVFQYYNDSTQKELFDRIYPSLYDSTESKETVLQAIYVTKLAFKKGIITEHELLDDLSAYTENFIKLSSVKIEDLERISSVFEEIGQTPNSMIKNILLQNNSIIDKITIHDSANLEKLIYILHLMVPTHKNEYNLIVRLCEMIKKSPIGSENHQALIVEWFRKYFTTNLKLETPELLLNLLDLLGDSSIVLIRMIEKQLTKWPRNYSKEVVMYLGLSKYSSLFFRTLENDSFASRENVIHACNTIGLFMEINIAFTTQYCNNFFMRVADQNIKTQKSILEYLILETSYGFDLHCYHISERVLKRYSFEDIDELANFSLFLYIAMGNMSESKYPIMLILNALQKLEGTKKKWKKAVESVELSNSIKNGEQIKRKIVSDICDVMVEDTQDKGNRLKKLMERFKKS